MQTVVHNSLNPRKNPFLVRIWSVRERSNFSGVRTSENVREKSKMALQLKNKQ